MNLWRRFRQLHGPNAELNERDSSHHPQFVDGESGFQSAARPDVSGRLFADSDEHAIESKQLQLIPDEPR